MPPPSEVGSLADARPRASDRSDAEWIAALDDAGDARTVVLTDLRARVLRAVLFTLERAQHYVGHLEASALGTIAEDCAREALTTIVQQRHEFRGDSRFTTWAYAYAVRTAFAAARREHRRAGSQAGQPA